MTLWDPYARADLFKIMQQWVNEARVDADTWGNALLRGVYESGSDADFSLATDKLRRWVRFLVYDSMHSAPTRLRIHHGKELITRTDPQKNDELWSRFSLEVLEDESVLRISDPGWYLNEQGLPLRLRNYFTDWVAAQRVDLAEFEGKYEHPCFRFNDFLVVDSASMASLLEMPEPPQPRLCNGMQEWNSLHHTGTPPPPAFVWMLDANLLKTKPRIVEEDPELFPRLWEWRHSELDYDKCVIKLGVAHMRDAYFERKLQRNEPTGLPCHEDPDGSGVWVYENELREW